MSNLTLKEIYDNRTMGELDDGVPLRIWVHCLSDDGAENTNANSSSSGK